MVNTILSQVGCGEAKLKEKNSMMIGDAKSSGQNSFLAFLSKRS